MIKSAAASALTALVLLAGCADKSANFGEGDPDGTSSTLADGGWIGGAPDMSDADSASKGGGGVATEAADSAGATEIADRSAASEAAPLGGAPMTSVAPDAGPLRAGNVDDNADHDGFIAYLARVSASGVPHRPLDVSGRVVVTVRGAAGLPASGVEVQVAEGGRTIATLRTTADGTARFHPLAYGAGDGPFTFSVGNALAEGAAGTTVDLTVPDQAAVERVPLDIAFAIDVTGSMGDELARLKDSVASVVERIEALPGDPDVRLAMTIYRDEGDSFVTATHDFTSDIGAFRSALAEVEAGGGGDWPEALDEAMDEVLAKPAWRPAGEATQLVFVVGDAGGHPERQVARPYTESMKDAAARGIKIIPIATSSTDDQAEVAFRQMAQFTGGRFLFLAYGAGGAATGSSTDIGPTDYEELSLDDLVVRLVADELAARTGTEVTPPTVATTTTQPAGQ